MEVSIRVVDRRNESTAPRTLHVKANNDETITIEKLLAIVRDSLDANANVELIHAGRKLVGGSSLLADTLHATTLHAIVRDGTSAKEVQSTPLSVDKPQFPRFFVYCKHCANLQAGKLRVRCTTCSSTGVLLQQEPSSWKGSLQHCSFTLSLLLQMFRMASQ